MSLTFTVMSRTLLSFTVVDNGILLLCFTSDVKIPMCFQCVIISPPARWNIFPEKMWFTFLILSTMSATSRVPGNDIIHYFSPNTSCGHKMSSYHKPKVFRSADGCCICKAKSSSSRFTDSSKYEDSFLQCFKLEDKSR